MNNLIFDANTFLLALCLSNLLMAGILSVFHRRIRVSKGVHWWIAGIILYGFHYLFKYLQIGLSSTNILEVPVNLLLVGGSFLIYYGIRRFFKHTEIKNRLITLTFIYALLTIVLSMFQAEIYQELVSSLSVTGFSIFSAHLLFINQDPRIKRFNRYLATAFLIHSIIFFLQGIFSLIPTSTSLGNFNLVFEFLYYYLSLAVSITWTFGFVFLVNEQQIKNTGETEQIFNQTINTIPDAVLITRLKDGLIIKVNQGFNDLTGYSTDEVIGNTTLDVNLWSDPTERQKYAILLTKTGSVENMEFRFVKKNNKELMGLVSAQRIEIDGEFHILSVVRDITSRKKMEEKLRENEEKYRFLAEYSGDVIWHINRSYRIDFISTADETIRGFKREEVIGQPIWNIFKPEGIKLIREKIEHHRQVEQVGNNMNVTRFEIEQRTKDGRWIWTDITAAPHYNKYGKLVGYHGISRDISERKRLIEELNRYATIDELCQIPNRRHFMSLAEKELNRTKRYHHKLSICLIDFDNLKAINDSYGHLAGDRALSVFSKMVQTLIREVDVIGRFGGDEFLILLPETDQDQAYGVIERIRRLLMTSPIHFQGESYKISISSGITGVKEWTVTLDELLNQADEALYKAKEAGGNCIAIYQKGQINIYSPVD